MARAVQTILFTFALTGYGDVRNPTGKVIGTLGYVGSSFVDIVKGLAMVKTRHSGDVDLETPPRFISLNNEKNRQSTRNSDAIENKLSHVYGNQNDLYNIFDDKVVESRLRPRIGPSRTYNYIDVDSSDEDSLQRQSHLVFTRSRQIKQEMLSKHVLRGSIRSSSSFREEDADQFVDDDDDNNIIQKRTSSVRHKESTDSKENLKDGNVIVRKKKYPSKHHPDEDISRGKISSRLSRGSEDDDDETGNFIRRSSRTRRQVYDTLNQSFLVSIPGQKKQTTEDNDHSDTKDDSEDNQEFSDMYSRVKRKRVRVKRNMYGIPVTEDSDSSPDIRKQNKNNSKDDEFESESQEGDAEDGMDGIEKDDFNNTSRRVTRKQNLPVKKIQPTIVKSYSLREHKPRTDLYKAPLEERKVKKMHSSIFIGTPVKKNVSQTYHSPAQRRNIRKRSAFHSSSSSTSSSSDGESSDEKSFKRCKTKSMAKARSRLMPMNYSTNALPPNIVKDRIRSGSSLADVEPMKIDKNITFSSIGGLNKHIQALKEMVVFPLLYDKVFQRFNVDPPRGVLFYGPPGTGKTLVARALANECSKGDRRVAFFMRKGADCLSKWVGESERQLRILFDQAYKFRPSIIFFDEIDGLAPVRSSRQDQIHSSIVSTLLALMDGLDNRGEIVVIGATNRIDSLDPALRRPGRFDREFFFPLPSFEARKQILKIHTDSWTPKLNDHFISELAEKCVGYCGADLKSLCTEAAMLALRRRYPQIYMTNEALQIDVTSINISARDFFDAVNNIIPTAQRSVNTPTRALPPRVQPLLLRQLNNAINTLKDIFPPCMTQTTSSLDATAATPGQTQLLAANSSVWDDLISDEDDNSPSIFVQPVSSKGKSLKKSIDENTGTSLKAVYLNFTRPATRYPSTFRPRLMLVGKSGQGQTTYIAPAIIHKMENLPIHVLDLPALYAVTAKTPEESCANVFLEARRKCPSIIYLPYINQWWDVMADTLKATLLTLIHDLNPSLPLLLLATSEQPYEDLDSVLQELFNHSSGEIIEMDDPNKEERRIYFRDLLLDQACKPPPQNRKAALKMLEVLPKAAPLKPSELTKQELEQLVEKEELTLMELRIFLRDVLNKLGSDKKFSIFAKPVNIENAPDYYEIIEHPMDLSTMMGKIDLHEYGTVKAFMNDIDLICSNALEYNPNRGPMDRIIRHRACALKDTAYAIIKTELDKDFEKTCVEIEESRKRRGHKSSTVPNFYFTKPQSQQPSGSKSQSVTPNYPENPKLARSIPKPEGERFSRRVRGLNTDPVPPLEAVEKVFKLSKSSTSSAIDENKDNQSNSKDSSNVSKKESTNLMNDPSSSLNQGTNSTNTVQSKGEQILENSELAKDSKSQPSSSSASKLKKKNKLNNIWCKPRRKRTKFMLKTEQSLQEAEMDVDEMEQCQDSKSNTEISHCHSSQQLSQQLRIETTENDTSEPKEEKFTTSGKSVRLKSPQISPTRVITRRSSMSPTNITLKSTEPSSSSQVQDKLTDLLKKDSTSYFCDQTKQSENKCNTELRKHGVTSETAEKPSAAKRLDLDSVVLDSGVGSSLDSNGDSRDSSDHSKTELSSKQAVITSVLDDNQNCNSELTSSVHALTDQSKKEVIIDKHRLASLLNVLVLNTEGFNVEQLEKIYSQFSHIIYNHRHNYNRNEMIVDLERKLEELVKSYKFGFIIDLIIFVL
ncbi:ATPase AAA domain-containing protein 2B [Bulinus truncatus]|nr:ATPase AAA domain-containing protein 2B [Bulinus truncatus]